MNKYTENVDFNFLASFGIHYVMHQPWQMGILYPDWDGGKFVWYPAIGTLMVEIDHRAQKLGEYTDTEDMYNAMRKYLGQHDKR